MAIFKEKNFQLLFCQCAKKKIATYTEVYWNKLEWLQNCTLPLAAGNLTVTVLFITDM